MNPMEMFEKLKSSLPEIQNMQDKLRQSQEKLKDIRVTGRAGGDMVEVELDGRMLVRNVRIAPELIKADEAPVLEELVKSALNDGISKAREAAKTEMTQSLGGAGGLGASLGGLGNIFPGMM